MNAVIISTGSELLAGKTLNTNAAHISKRLLQETGIATLRHITVGDDKEIISSALREALASKNSLIIFTGGLGPTFDDITLSTLAQTLNKTLILDKEILKNIHGHFTRRKIPMPQCNIRQAYIPKGAIALKNDIGTAPGIILPCKGKIIIALPGPPAELNPMLEKEILPYLKKRYKTLKHLYIRRVRLTGLSESAANEKIEGLGCSGIYAHPGIIDVEIQGTSSSEVRSKIKKIEKQLGDYIFGYDNQTLEETVGQLLKEKSLTLGIAESCTGGLLCHRITNIPNCSAYFLLGAVTYAEKTKESLLGVSPKTLRTFGAVSKETAIKMAEGIRKTAKSDIGISITGLCGPKGGTKEKPVGTVYIGFSAKKGSICKEHHFTGNREHIKLRASSAALDMIRRYLLSNEEHL